MDVFSLSLICRRYSSTDSETADKFDRHIRLARSRHGVSACEKVFFICRIIHIIKFVLYIRGDTFSILPPPEAGHAQPVGAGAPQANGMIPWVLADVIFFRREVLDFRKL